MMITIIVIIPIAVTLERIVNDTSDEHDWNAQLPILVTLVGIVTDVSDEHDINAKL